MKIKLTEDRVFPTLGIVAVAGDEVEVPEEAFPAPVVASPRKSAPAAKEVNDDGSAPL
jgi:hypothetical protein